MDFEAHFDASPGAGDSPSRSNAMRLNDFLTQRALPGALSSRARDA